jgi:hypothetical protein
MSPVEPTETFRRCEVKLRQCEGNAKYLVHLIGQRRFGRRYQLCDYCLSEIKQSKVVTATIEIDFRAYTRELI